jgi:hypothetical protein
MVLSQKYKSFNIEILQIKLVFLNEKDVSIRIGNYSGKYLL